MYGSMPPRSWRPGSCTRCTRCATARLPEAATRTAVPLTAVSELRDFVVGALDHHHVSEDDLLWPMIIESAPELAEALAGLSAEHEQLEAALETLQALT